MMVNVHIQKGKAKSTMLANATLKGVALNGSEPGRIIEEGDSVEEEDYPSFVGVWKTTARLLKDRHASGRPYTCTDNGYFKPYKEGYFRITRNTLQHDGSGNHSPHRYEALDDKKIQPWRKGGREILILLQSPMWHEMFTNSWEEWLKDTVDQIRQFTDRPVVARAKPKPNDPPLEASLEGVHAVVGLSSNGLLQALLQGYPVIALGQGPTSRLSTPMHKIEDPLYLDGREQLAWNLAHNQWTLEEIQSGKAWRELHSQPPPKRCEILG